MVIRTLLVFWLLGGLSQSVSAQAPIPDLVGVVDPNDRIALALLEWTSEGWVQAASPEDSASAAARGYFRVRQVFVRDTAAEARSLPVAETVRAWEFSLRWWGYRIASMEWPAALTNRTTYVVSDTAWDAPFRAELDGQFPDSTRLLALFDSLAPVPDSTSVGIWDRATWRGALKGETLTFFRAMRSSTSSPFCYFLEGMARTDSQIVLQGHGYGDCEKASRHTPYALLRRDDRMFVLMRRNDWEGWALEVWEGNSDGQWSVAAIVY